MTPMSSPAAPGAACHRARAASMLWANAAIRALYTCGSTLRFWFALARRGKVHSTFHQALLPARRY
jgi:hypothetical protein